MIKGLVTPNQTPPFWLQPPSPGEASCARLLWTTTDHTSHWTRIHTHTNTRGHGDGIQSPHETITQSQHGGAQVDRPSYVHGIATVSCISCVPGSVLECLIASRACGGGSPNDVCIQTQRAMHTGIPKAPPESSHRVLHRSLWCHKALRPL